MWKKLKILNKLNWIHDTAQPTKQENIFSIHASNVNIKAKLSILAINFWHMRKHPTKNSQFMVAYWFQVEPRIGIADFLIFLFLFILHLEFKKKQSSTSWFFGQQVQLYHMHELENGIPLNYCSRVCFLLGRLQVKITTSPPPCPLHCNFWLLSLPYIIMMTVKILFFIE